MQGPIFNHALRRLTEKYRTEAATGIHAAYSSDGTKVLEIVRFFIQEHDRWLRAWKVKEQDIHTTPSEKKVDPGSFVFGMLVMAEQILGETLLMAKEKGLTLDESFIDKLLRKNETS